MLFSSILFRLLMGAKSCRYFWAVDSMWLNKKNEKKHKSKKALTLLMEETQSQSFTLVNSFALWDENHI